MTKEDAKMQGKVLVGGAMLLSLAVGALGTSTARMMSDGTQAQLMAFTCHATAQTCTAEFRITKEGKFFGEKQVRFGFDGKARDSFNRDLYGRIPGDVAACAKAFQSKKFDGLLDLK